MNSFVCKTIVVSAVLCLIPSSMLAQRGGAGGAADPAAAPTPRTADGHPDLTGLWAGGGGGAGGGVDTTNPDYDPSFTTRGVASDAKGFAPSLPASRSSESCPAGGFTNGERDGSIIRRMGTNKPLYKPQYWDTVNMLDHNSNHEDPSFNCMPAGVPRLGAPTQIYQTATQLAFIYPAQGGAIATPPAYRIIPIDGRQHTNLEDLDGSWNGESIGHWEGDTLVIDTIGFNTGTWLDMGGYFHSENLHVVERMTRKGNTMTWQATVEDPDVLLKPWVLPARTVQLNPDPKALMGEAQPCSERDMAHAVTKEHH